MGSILTNGVFLPAEGERNCYTGLAANWSALDRLIGGYNAHIGNTTIHVTAEDKQAWNGKADNSALTAHTGDATIHVTAEDKQAWNGKADNSALTAHTGDTTIHVTAEDKEAWNGKADASALTAHTGDTTIHVTAADKAKWDAVTSKADDSAVVHKSGNETVGGIKSFNDLQIIGYGTQYKGSRNAYILPEFSASYSGLAITTLSFGQSVKIGNYVLDANNKPSLDASKGYVQFTVGENNNVNTCILEPRNSTSSSLGTSSNKWSTINGLNPGALSLPDLSNGIDISSYFTATGTSSSSYTPIVDGWICIKCVSTLGSAGIYVESTKGFYASAGNLLGMNSKLRFVNLSFPVIKGEQYTIALKTVDTSIVAKFFPCQGNV